MNKQFLTAAAFCAVTAGVASAQSGKKYDFEFINVADSPQGLSNFQTFPAINNKGQVVFVAFRSGVGQGVFRSQNGELTTIASDSDGLRNFGNNVAINAPGVVVFQASSSSGSVVILTGDGRSKR